MRVCPVVRSTTGVECGTGEGKETFRSFAAQ